MAGSAFVATNTATAAAVLVWVFAEWVTRRKPTVLGAAIGAVAGLVAITPATDCWTHIINNYWHWRGNFLLCRL